LAGEDYFVTLDLSFSTANLSLINSDRVPGDLTQLGLLSNPGTLAWSTSLTFSDPLTDDFVRYGANFRNFSRRTEVSTPGTSMLLGIGTLMLAGAIARRRKR
jgi:hypothetical protein